MIYSFGDCKINTQTRQLLVAGKAVAIEHRQFQLLKILAQADCQVVSREDLIAQLWPRQIVSDASLARLVSDTRKLIGDNGKSQHIIKTCRGGGFILVLVVINDKQAHTVYMKKRAILISVCLALLLIVLGYLNATKSATSDSDYRLILKIQQHLNISKTAFMAQLKRRDELGEMLGIKRNGQRIFWEKEFSAAFASLNPKQRFVFDQIRGITNGAIYPANKAIADIFSQNPQLTSQVDSFEPLINHLNYWLAKYNQVFSPRNDMCLLYVGVEDGVPFPKTVDADVAAWLQQHQK